MGIHKTQRKKLIGLVMTLLALTATTTAYAEGRLQKYENKVDCYVWNETPQKAETVTWSGNCVAKRADGLGKEVWRYLVDGKWNEDIYIGMMRKGLQQGRGAFVWADGSRYEGEFKEGKLNGRGIIVEVNDYRYEGEIKDNKPHGRGVYVRDGARYEGEFSDGKMNGRGVLVLGNDTRYVVEAKDGEFISKVKIKRIN